uniref:Transposase (Putative), gypsy type n=1 Tax=Tanacetum cinerariifolium TaxID=118510 RepID=A0A6L2M865_TANCI|nr:transposase (putative), gypsy type [Tanacetum cinerariifolium]
MTVSLGLTPMSFYFSFCGILRKRNEGSSPTADEFSAEASGFLATHQASFRKFSESFLCLVGISHYYELDDNVYPVFLTDDNDDPTKVWIGEKQIEEGQVPMREFVVDEEVKATAADKPKVQKKRRRADGASDAEVTSIVRSSAPPPPVPTTVVATTAIDGATSALVHKSRTRLVHRRFFRDSVSPSVTEADITYVPNWNVINDFALDHPEVCQSMVDQLALLGFFSQLRDMDYEQLFAKFNVGVARQACFSAEVRLRSEHNYKERKKFERMRNRQADKRRRADGASGFDHPSKKLREDHVTSSDVGASTGGKSLAAIRELFERIVATTAIDGTTSALVHVSRTRPVHRRFFRDSVSPSVTEANIVGPSQPVGAVVSAVCQSMVDQLAPLGFFSQLRDMDYEQLFAEFNVGVARQACFSAEVRLRSEHNYRERKKFERMCNRQADVLKEKDVEIANLKALLSLKEDEAAKAIRLCGQVATVEAAEAAKVGELNCFKERNAALEVSLLEATCFGLRDQVLVYELFKEQYEAVQDEQINILSDKVAGLDAELMEMALHLDGEFYPCFLTTIAGRRFETYVKSKDLDLWHVITNGDFQPIQQNSETKLDEAKKESSDEECSTSRSEDKEYAMAVRDFKKFFKR